jgi:acylpyruvate hydrolase
MKLATARIDGGTRAVRVDGDEYVDLGVADVGALLADPGWSAVATSTGSDALRYRAADEQLAPLVLTPRKIVCVGLNYRNHILEMGRELPEYPTLFAKFTDALVGSTDDIFLPPESGAMDWEAELVVVIGRSVRRADEEHSTAAIAGFTVMNDVTMRDWQLRTREWLQGKTFEGTTPLGPVLVTPDELPGGVRPTLAMTCTVNGETVQQADTGDLVFDPVALVRYVSTIGTLRPGDIIASGTPGGVGHARTPPRYLNAGDTVVTTIDGIGQLTNVVTVG